MTDPGILGYAGIFAACVAVSLVVTPLALRLALRTGVLDRPNDHYKLQESPIPYLGGAAIVFSFALVLVVGALVRPPNSGLDDFVLIVAIGFGLSLVGLVDDLRRLGPLIRLVAEIAAAIVVVRQDVTIEVFGNDVIDSVITVAWIVGVTNAINFLDNMDGLSAGVSAIASFFFFVLAADNGQFLVATLALALSGCAIGFLRSNFHPARIYMGDAGAMFIGFMLAIIGVKLRFDGPNSITFFVPILVLGVALFDTALVVITRSANRLNPMSGGRDHSSHRLVFLGLSVRVAVVLIYAGAVSLGWLAIVMSRIDRDTGRLLMAWVIVTALALGITLGRVPVYASSKRRRLMLHEIAEHEADDAEPPAGPGPRLLHIDQVKDLPPGDQRRASSR